MTLPVKPEPAPPGLCWFAVQRLPPLLDAFTREIDGVRLAEDPEYIHRMRVASRRLRAALPLFRSCFTPKQYQRWMRDITRITRALGEARDADVQIAYLRKFLKKEEKQAERSAKPSGDRPGPAPAAQYLLALLVEQRKALQPPVLEALDQLARSGTPDEMRTVLFARAAEIQAYKKRPSLHAVPMTAAWRIEKRLDTLLSFEPWISHPEAIAEHHATRIAAKKLRYTLEIFGPLYRNSLGKYLVRIKRIQEILGDLHDCDVWIEKVTRILLKERSLLRSQKDTKRPSPATLASLKTFLAHKEKERRMLYRSFTRYWALLHRTGIFTDLQKSLLNNRKSRVCPPLGYSRESADNAVEDLSSSWPEGIGHSRHVTRLALQLFDALQPVHAMGGDDRHLLEYAGLLHDIGWRYGEKRHNRRGALMVTRSENLPFDLTERSIISLCIFLHRGGMNYPAEPLYSLLPPRDQKRALALASLLRMGDGLDYLHNGRVRDISITMTPGTVTVEIMGDEDCSGEKERAKVKSDLFASTFGLTVVIQ